MARRLLCAAAYRPSGGNPGPSFDEDAFTIAATALERTSPQRRAEPSPLSLALVGEVPASLDWAWPVLLGGPVHLQRSAASASGLSEALRTAAGGSEGPALVVATGSLLAKTTPGELPTVAVAFRFDGPKGPGSEVRLEPADGAGSLVEAAIGLFRAHSAGDPGSQWVGDWAELARTAAAESAESPAESSTDRVSQGAYVPRARYLENLPSRWRFTAERCGACAGVTFPARGKCRSCGRTEGLTAVDLPHDEALVVATTVIGAGGQPTEFDPQVERRGPYEVVLAELAPGARVTLQVTDSTPGEVRIGDRVDSRLRRLYAMDGEWRYGRKAVPRPGSGAGPR